MATSRLEAAVASIAGRSSLPMLAQVVTRCRTSRYGWRSRREERLGEVIDAWYELQYTAQRASDLLSTSYHQVRHRLLREASRISQSFLAAMASCFRTSFLPPSRHSRELAEPFLDLLFQQINLTDMLEDMQEMIEQLGNLIATIQFGEEWPELGFEDCYDEDDVGRSDDGYGHGFRRIESHQARMCHGASGPAATMIPPPAPNPPSVASAVYAPSSYSASSSSSQGRMTSVPQALYPATSSLPGAYQVSPLPALSRF